MTERPKRRRNRLKNYDYATPGADFVTICVKEHRNLLGKVVVGADDHIGPQVELTDLGQTVKRYVCGIPGLVDHVIMPNHLHLYLVIPEAEHGPMWASAPTQSVSARIRTFKPLVTKAVGEALFQRSFYDHVVWNEADALRIREYIRNNPAKWEEDRFYAAKRNATRPGGFFHGYSKGAKAFISMPPRRHQKPGWAASCQVMRWQRLSVSWKSASMWVKTGVSSR